MSFTAKTPWAIAALCGAIAGATPALARDFNQTSMDFVGANVPPGAVRTARVNNPELLSATENLADGTFTQLDLRIPVSADTAEEVRRMVDQGYASEPSGCAPGAYGPLDMENGLRYFFELDTIDENAGEAARVTVYAGDRATHWTNDVFCEYDANLGADAAVLRISGFFYVIHRNVPGGADIQLRAVTLTQEEIERYAVRN